MDLELDREFRADIPIRQGDLLGFWDWTNLPPLNQYGVVITADCDIANGAADQELVYLRIILQSDYLDIFWARKKLERLRAKHVSDLTAQIGRLRKLNLGAEIPLDEADVLRWAQTSTPDDICDELKACQNDKQKLTNAIERTRSAIQICKIPIGSGCLAALCELRGEPRSRVVAQAVGELSKLRDELFFVSSLTDPNDQSGYYVLLDSIGAIRRDAISDSLYDVKSGTKRVFRLGRLKPMYKYAVAQRFAFLFQRIGLPDAHSIAHTTSLARLGHEDAPETEL